MSVHGRHYYLVPASGGIPTVSCPKCILGSKNAAGTKRIVRCTDHLGGVSGVTEMTHAEAIAKTAVFSDESGDVYVGLS